MVFSNLAAMVRLHLMTYIGPGGLFKITRKSTAEIVHQIKTIQS